MDFKIGDIIRIGGDFKEQGLFEVVSVDSETPSILYITKDECDSERQALRRELILVRRFEDREDVE